MTPFPTRHLSVSSVQLYLRCPASWHRRYVLGITEPLTAPMAFGSVMAKALEALHLGKDADVAFVVEHAKAMALGPIAPGAEYGLQLLRLYRERGVFKGEPEVRFRLFLPDRKAVPLPLLMVMDLVADRRVVEFKTSMTKWTQEKVNNEFQATVYGWGYQQVKQHQADAVHYVVMSTSSPSITEFETYPTGLDLRVFERVAAKMYRDVLAGKFDPCGTCRVCKPRDVQDDTGPRLVFGGTA